MGIVPTISARRDFVSANHNSKKFITSCFILLARTRPDDHPAKPQARFGFTVTKKIGGAVTRNRVKRRLREATKRLAIQHSHEKNDYVIIARHKAIDCEYSVLERDMEFAFSRIHAMKEGAKNPRNATSAKPT